MSRSSARSRSSSRASCGRSTGAAWSSWRGRSRRARSASSCAASTRSRSRRCGGTARRSRPPSASPRGCRCWCRASAGSRRRFATSVDGLTFDGLDADDLARQLDRLALEPGLLERAAVGDRARRGRSPTTSTSSRPTTRVSARVAQRRRRPLPGRRRPCAGRATTGWRLQPLDHQRPQSPRALSGPVQRIARDGATALDPPLAARRRRRGAPPVAAGSAPAQRPAGWR